jgi:CBS-domain-containing membrane protein
MTGEQHIEHESGEPEADVLTGMTRVSEARSLAGEAPCVVPEDINLREVARQMWQRRGVRTAAVVDAEGRLAGIIPLRLLLDELFFHVTPEEFISEILEPAYMEEVGRMVRAEKAGDLMQPPVYVTLSDTVKDAFSRMHDHKLEGLPIVDEGMRPVGYLDRFQLLEVWIRVHGLRGSGSL